MLKQLLLLLPTLARLTMANPESSSPRVGSGGYWDIRLSPNSITSVPFGAGHVTVWEHAESPGRFYAMPLVYLLHESAETRLNVLIGKYEMKFDVMMWSVEAREAVFRHLKDETRPSLKLEDVEMLPMEKVRLVWRGNVFAQHSYEDSPSQPFWLNDRWKSNIHLPSIVNFQFICNEIETCNLLEQSMKDSPDMFHGLELEYIINGQRSSRRKVSVAGTSITSGTLFTELENMPGAEGSSVRYITSGDLKTIVQESTSNVLASVTTDSDYVDTGDEVSVANLLERVLGRDQVTTASFTPHMWESVFWNPTWARPYKFVSFLNKALEKDTSDSKNFLLTEYAKTSSARGSGGGSFLKIFSAKAEGGSESSKSEKVQKEDVLNTLRERHSNIEWTGEVFRVKPMRMHRLNLANLNTSSSITVANLQIHRYESVQSISVRVTPTEAQVSSLTPQLVQSRLQDELDSLKGTLSKRLSDSEVATANAHSDISLLTNVDADLHARLAKAESKLTTLPGWPHGSYCILEGGSGCPSGFNRVAGHLKALSMHAVNSAYVGAVQFGGSNIRCHGSCGQWGNWAELNLVLCCK